MVDNTDIMYVYVSFRAQIYNKMRYGGFKSEKFFVILHTET